MKINVYYRTVISRPDPVKKITTEVFLALCSWPRIVIENITRLNMGERYYNFGISLFVIMVLCSIPVLTTKGMYLFTGNPYYRQLPPDFYLHNLTWYIYMIILLNCTIKRRNEIKRLPSVFDFGRYSLSTGAVHPLILNLKWKGKKFDYRTIETIIEPGIFFLIGLALWIFGQNVGMLLMICSFFYSMSYRAAYREGDEFTMKKIDELLCNRGLADMMQKGTEPHDDYGFRYYGKLPDDHENRKLLIESFFEEEAIEVI